MAKKIEIDEIKDKADEAVKAARQEAEEVAGEVAEEAANIKEDVAGQVEELIGCDCGDESEAATGDVNACGCGDTATSFAEEAEEMAESAKASFENVVNEAQKYVSGKIDEFPADEVKAGAKSAVDNVKGALANHGIDTDVLGSKIAEDASNLLGGLLGAVAAGANVIADAANKGAENLSGKKQEDCGCGCEGEAVIEDIEDVDIIETGDEA